MIFFGTGDSKAQNPNQNQVGQVISHFVSKHPIQKLKWDWGESVFLYGLSKHPQYQSYLKSYVKRWAQKKPPRIDRSDMCSPALVAVELIKTNPDPEAIYLAELVEDYIKKQTQNPIGALDHLGHSFFSYFYPSSIWVDSLMMYALFAGEWGKLKNDKELIHFALSQPLKFAQVLQDKNSGLFWHAFLFNENRTIPKDATFWLRGNAWALTAIIELVDLFQADESLKYLLEKNITLFKNLAQALAIYQKDNGAFETVVNRPGYSYDETSGTLLVAYAFAKGYRLGILSEDYKTSAKNAFQYAQGKLKQTKHGPSLSGISAPTNPGSAFYYKHIAQKSDLSYGVGAYLLAAKELLP